MLSARPAVAISLAARLLVATLLVALAAGALGAVVPDRASAITRTLRSGSHGRDVLGLQRDLSAAGYYSDPDGSYGARTTQRVREFERAHHLAVDGVVDPAEARRIHRAELYANAHPAPFRRAHVNARGLAVAPRGATPLVKAVIASGNRIAHKPYRLGGGHARWEDRAYDCSGSVGYALHRAGMLDQPRDSTGFERYGKRRAGRWITIFANPRHVYMVVAGLRFDTTARAQTGSRWTPAQRPSDGFVVRHPYGL